MRKKRSRHPLQGFFVLKQKQEEAIKYIQNNCPEGGYFLGFSGGKDSVVLHHLTKLSKVKFKAYYSSTGIDPPELVSFIKRHFPKVKFLRAKEAFLKLIPKKGFPTIHARWCCDALKKNQTKKIPPFVRLMGLRAEESHMRAKRGRESKIGKIKILKPIFHWNEYEIWEYIDRYKLPYCKLYDEGFDRIGCMVCPFICYPNSRKLKQAKEKWPGMFKAFERAMKELWNKRKRQKKKGYSNNFKQFLQNWYDGKSINKGRQDGYEKLQRSG